MELSVVIPARNEATTLPTQLDALLAEEVDAPFEVIVADNGSTDDTAAVVRGYAERDPRVRLVDASHGKGWTSARNAGSEAATGRFLVFVDADDLIAPGYLQAMYDGVQRTGFAAAQLEHRRLNPAWSAAVRGHEQLDDLVLRPYGPPRPYAYGNTLAVRRDYHLAIGGLDEEFGPSCDMDYCYRLQRDTGAELVFVPDAVLHYRHRTSLRATLRQSISYAADEMRVQAHHEAEWRTPLEVLSLKHVVLRNGRRLLKPDAGGGPVSSKVELGRWLWGLGTDIGRRQGARELAAA